MHWYDWHTVTERLQGRSYALTRGQPYKVVLDPTTPTGCCDFTEKRILINPNLFDDVFRAQGLSGQRLDEANFLVSRAVTGHEALHVLYSDPETVSEAAQESPVLKTVVNVLEDARIEGIGSKSSHVSKTLFGFVNRIARSQLPEFTDPSLQNPSSVLSLLLKWRLGAEIPKLEGQAITLWRKLARLLDTALVAPSCAEVLAIARDIVKLAGLDSQSAQDPELQPFLERTESNMTGDRDSQPLPNPVPGGQDSPDEEESAGPEETPSEEVCESESGPSGAEQDDHHETTDGSVGGGVDSLDSEDLEKLVEETAQRASEHLGSLVPPDAGSLAARSKPCGRRRYSDISPEPYIHYLPEVAPIASEIVRELKAEGPRAVCGPSDSPGKFRARYYVRDSSRPFAARKFQGLSTPDMALSLILDRSGSMEHIIHELRVMAMAISSACETLRIPLSIWALEGQVHLKHFDERGPQVLARLAGIRAETLTRTMPTIQDAVTDLRSRPEELKQIVMIHDGIPADRPAFIEWRTSLRGIGLFCLFIVRDEDYPLYRESPAQLREHMNEVVGPQQYAIAPVSDIARHWCSYIRNTRNRYAAPVL